MRFLYRRLGNKYSKLAQEECKIALDDNKRCLIYIKDVKEELREHIVNEFIEKELKYRISYHKFRSRKQLLGQIRSDLKAQMTQILRAELEDVNQKKRQ